MRTKSYWIIPLLVWLIYSCERWDLEQLNFVQLELQAPIPLGTDSAAVTASFSGLIKGRIEDHGFVWSRESETPSLFNNDGAISLGVLENRQEGTFSDKLVDLRLNSQYFVRAYTTVEQEIRYSNAMSFSTGTIQLITGGIRYLPGTWEVEVTARIKDIDKQGVVAFEHGFCYYTEVDSLSLIYTSLLSRNSSEPFTDILPVFQANVRHFYRPYAFINLEGKEEIVYGSIVSFDGKVSEVWEQVGIEEIFPAGHGLIDLGNGLYLSEQEEVIYEFITIDNSFILIEVAAFPYKYAFTIGEFVYGFEKFDQQSNNFDKKSINFYALHVNTGIIEPRTTYPEGAGEMINSYATAVNFSFNGKGYYGGGLSQELNIVDYIESHFTDLLWCYDPQSDTWTSKNNLPLAAETKVFEWNDQIYLYPHSSYEISNLIRPTTSYRTIYRYDAAQDNWEEVADVPGDENGTSVMLGLHDKLYVGAGLKSNGLISNQWWSYSLSDQEWSQLANLEKFVSFPEGLSSFSGSIQNGRILLIGFGSDPIDSQFFTYPLEYHP